MRTARPLRMALGLYVGAVMLAAALALATAIRSLSSALSWQTLALLAGLALVLELMVVPLAGGGGASISFAAYFAGLLVVGPAPTAVVAGAVTLVADASLRRSPISRAGFNAAHASLSVLVSGWLYQELGGRIGGVTLLRDWLPAVAAGGLLWALEAAWVAAAVGLEKGRRALVWFRASLLPMLILDAALAAVGLLLALLYQSRLELATALGWPGGPLLAMIAVIPTGLLYYAYRLQGQVRQAYANSLRALSALVEAKAEIARPGHSERVADLAVALARAMDAPPGEVEQIRYAAFLHDIGKVGVPSVMLHRPRDEFAGESPAARQHAQLGEQILSPVGFLASAARMIRSHHERWDGLGYPDGLRGAQIPLGARVIALADAHAILAETMGPWEALRRLAQAAGSRFDPALVSILLEILRQQAPAGQPGRRLSALATAGSSPGPAWWR